MTGRATFLFMVLCGLAATSPSARADGPSFAFEEQRGRATPPATIRTAPEVDGERVRGGVLAVPRSAPNLDPSDDPRRRATPEAMPRSRIHAPSGRYSI